MKIKNILLILFGLIFSLIFIELLLRIFFFISFKQWFGLSPARSTLKFYDNEIIGHAFIPNQEGWFVSPTREYFTWVYVNSHGFADVEHAYTKPDDTFRIIILGDSFVENIQVSINSRFFRLLENKLNDLLVNNEIDLKGKKKVEVIALGRGNTGTAQQYLILKNYGIKYSPDLIIHMFLSSNDIKNNSFSLQNDPYLPYFEIDSDNNLIEVAHIKRDQRKNAFIKENLKQLKIVELLLNIRQKFNDFNSLKTIKYPQEFHIYDNEYSDEYKKAWEITKRLILETRNLAQKNSSEYILVSLPNNEQVNMRYKDYVFNSYPINKNQVNMEKPNIILNNFCIDEKIECYSMVEYFKNYLIQNPNVETHFFFDGHWNTIGTNLASEFLNQRIIEYFKRGDKRVGQ